MVIVLAFAGTSCQKESCEPSIIEDSHIDDQVGYTIEKKDDLICSYARILASSIKDIGIRSVIKEEAQLQFDGDYDILTSKLQHVRLPYNEMTVEHKMSEINIQTRSDEGETNVNLEELMKEIQKALPNLQVSVPIHCDDWDTENYVPLVAFKPSYYTDDSPDTIQAFDAEGNLHILSREVEPDFPVIVVSESERVRPDGTLYFENDNSKNILENLISTKAILNTPTGLYLKHSTSKSFDIYWDAIVSDGYYEIQRRALNEYTFRTIGTVNGDENFYKNSGLIAGTKYDYRIRLVNGNEQSAYTSVVTSTASERSVNDPLRLIWYKIHPDFMSQVEKWDSGRPELQMIIYYGVNSAGASAQYETHSLSPKRNNLKAGCNPDLLIFEHWDPSDKGTALKVIWIEEDGFNENGPTEIVVDMRYENQMDNGNLTWGSTVKYSQSNYYYNLGMDEVCWWDSPTLLYNEINENGSIFEFKFGK
jgi:hypothetical protein